MAATTTLATSAMKHHDHSGEGARRDRETFTEGLFAVPAYDQPIPTAKPKSEREARAVNQLVADLIALVQSMRGRYAVLTVDDIRECAVTAGLLREKGVGREMAFLGGIPKRCGLVATGKLVRSRSPHGHGNILREWRFP